VAGLQEATQASRRDYLSRDRSWRVYFPANMRQDPVIWNPRVYQLVSAHEVKLSHGARIENPRGGLMRYRALWAPVVRLRQIATGYTFSMINVHLLRDAVNAGRRAPHVPRTFAVYVHQVRALKLLVAQQEQAGLPVYVAGDFNTGYAADRQVRLRRLPYHKLTHRRLIASWQGHKLTDYGTHMDTSCPRSKSHCGSYIDQIWAPMPSVSARDFVHEIHSDHYPITATYNIPQSAGFVAPMGTVGFQDTAVSSPEYNKPWQSRQNPMVFRLDGNLTQGFADVQVAPGGTAVEGQDFTLDDSSLYDEDLANDRVLVYTVPNTRSEPDKTFTLNLVNAFDTTVTQGVATGTILNDD
jgi:endonuclease/exonuclease/phosphatase family metal-dependent hydrolase